MRALCVYALVTETLRRSGREGLLAQEVRSFPRGLPGREEGWGWGGEGNCQRARECFATTDKIQANSWTRNSVDFKETAGKRSLTMRC